MTERESYQSPDNSPDEIQSGDEWEPALAEAARSLAQTRPWVLLLSIVGFIISASCILYVLAMFFIERADEMTVLLGVLMIIPILIFIGIVVLAYTLPSLLLWRYGRRIGRFLESRNRVALAAAIAAQRSFWRYVGILTVAVMTIYAFVIVAMIFTVLMG